MKIMLKLIISPEHVLKTLVIRVDPFLLRIFVIIIHRRNDVVQYEGHRSGRDSHFLYE